MEISIYAIIIWITAIFIVSLDIVLLIGSNKTSSKVFAIFSFLTAIWVISQGFFISALDANTATLLIKIQYALGILIAIGFYHFSKIYPHDQKPSTKSVIVSITIGAIFFYFFVFTNELVSNAYYIGGINRWGWNFGNFNIIFDFSFYLLWLVALFKIYRNFKSATGNLRVNLGSMFLALLLGIIPPTVVDIFLPFLGNYSMNWIGPLTSFIWISIVAYSIIRYRQMNVKMVIAEVVAIGMTIVFFINIFIDVSSGIFLRIFIFIIFILLALYLIYISLKDAEQKDLLLSWNDSLGQKVAEQTKEIRAAYELEQKAKWELEKLNETKDRFITLTQHNMRVPLTSLQHSLKLGNSTDASLSADNLARIIDDFRNIAGMKPGSKILNIGIHNCKGMIEETVRELGVDIRRMNITVKHPQDTTSWPNLHIDGNKMKEVIVILLENAIKYNIPGGRVDMCTTATEDTFELSITNTGLGISSEEKENIENKSFYRGTRAHTVNPIGMGVGLRIATAIVNGHNGILALTSDGIDKDVTAKITLPLRQARS